MPDSQDPKLFGGEFWDERKAFDYLLSRLASVQCPVCNSKKYYLLGRKRLRCTGCRKDYNPLRDSKFSDFNLPYSKLLYLLKLFELQISARSASTKAKVSLKTAHRFFHVARRAILEEVARNDTALKDRMGFGGARTGKSSTGDDGHPILFGIWHKKGTVCIDVLKDITTATLFGSAVKTVRRGSIVYTEKWMGYDSVVFYGYSDLPQEYKKRTGRGLVYIDRRSSFWSVAEERLMRDRPRSSEELLQRLKELEWRYNNMKKDIFALMAHCLLVAEHD